DRGATTLSVWTRSRGAYVWPLPSGPVPTPTRVVSRKIHETIPTMNGDIDLLPPFPAVEMRRNTGADTTGSNVGHDHEVIFDFGTGVTIPSVQGCTAWGGATCTASASGSTVTADLHG